MQGDPGTGADKLRRLPAQPARLPFKTEWGWQIELWRALGEGIMCIADFIGHPWRPRDLPANEYHMTAIPLAFVGTQRSAPYQEVTDRLGR